MAKLKKKRVGLFKTETVRQGAIKNRVQVRNPHTKKWTKINTNTGKIMSHKQTSGPYKGVRKVDYKRRYKKK